MLAKQNLHNVFLWSNILVLLKTKEAYLIIVLLNQPPRERFDQLKLFLFNKKVAKYKRGLCIFAWMLLCK